ncbi:vitellogenin-1-like [Anneissia japonica]|uniref:vitellogenin-1-like n=1 Tax=Anneissia japonica TaxID=1529436 RepID=UPI001425A8C3|nr:vitellogenin-1-like [Anneissia japonica]
MKAFILALCVAVACAETIYLPRQQSREYETRFEAKKSYLYKYETIVLSGFPQSGKEFQGHKLNTFVNITFMTEGINKRAFLQLVEPQLLEVNGTVFPTNFTVNESSMSENLKLQLTNRIEFHYSLGNVTEVFAPTNETEWTLNIKRGILNIFILRLEDDEDSTVFSRYEEGISGICDTMYQIEKRRNIDEILMMNITKVRDFTNCTYTPTKLDTRAETKTCIACEDTKTSSLKSMATFHYNVTGSRTNFIIDSVLVHGLYVFYPYSIEGGSARTLVNQSLVLVNVTKTTDVVPEITIEKKSFGGIFHTFPKLMKSSSADIIPKVEFFLEQLKETVQESMAIDAPSHFIHLVNVLRLADYDTLFQIWEKYELIEQKKEWLLEALPLIGTEEVTKLMKVKILEENIKFKEAEKFLTKLTFTKKPTEIMIDNVLDICRNEKWNLTYEMSRTEMMEMIRARRACWLTLGNLVGEFCNEKRYCPTKYVVAFSRCEDIYTDIVDPTEFDVFETLSQKIISVNGKLKIDSTYDDATVKRVKEIRETEVKLMCINSMGNAGLRDHVFELTKIVEDPKNRLGIRVAAVHAMRKIAPKEPKKVLSSLLPIMRDPFSDEELRIICYLVAMECQPRPTLLVSFAENLKNETSKQFRTFVSSHLMNLAKSEDPCKKKLIKAAKYAIETTKLYNDGPFYSKNRQISVFNDDFQAGGTIEMNTIFTPGNLLPRSANTKLNLNILGKSLDVFEFGYRAEGLTNVLEKMFAPEGFWYKRTNLMNFLKRSTRSITGESLEEMIKQKVKPFTSEPEPSQGYTWFKIFGQEMSYEAFNKEFFKSILTEGKIRTNFKDLETQLREPQTFNWNKGMLLLDYQRQVPTICGMPLSLNITMASIVTLEGEVMMRVTPFMLSKNPTDIASNIKIKPRMALNVVSKMGIDCTLIKTGVAMNTTMNFTLPVESEVVYSFGQKKLRLDIENQKNDYFNVFSLNHTLYTFTSKMDCPCDNFTIINGSFTNNITNTSSCFQAFNGSTQLCSNMTYVPRLGVRKAPFRPLVGSSSWNIYAMRGVNSSERIIFEYSTPTTTTNITNRLLTVRTFGGYSPETLFTLNFTLDKPEEKFNLTIRRSDVPDWFCNITCKVMAINRSEVNFTMEWGLPKNYSYNITDGKILYPTREFFVMVNSVRNITFRNRTFEITWAEVPQWLQNFTSDVRMKLPVILNNMWLIEDLDITRIPKLSTSNHTINITLQAKKERTIDIIMDLPLQRVQIFNMTLPTRSDIIQKRVPLVLKQFKREVTDKFFRPTCTLNNFNNFTTFDGVNYRYRMPVTCPHILARDCSPEQRFTVLLQNRTMADNTVKKVVTIRVGDHQILLDSHLNKTIKIEVDGENLWINSYNLTQNFTFATFRINVSRTEVNVTTPIGLTVIFNTENVTTVLTPWYYNQTCGMCGDFNGETAYEYVTPENQITSNSTKFAMSWLVPGDGNTAGSCNLIKKYVYPLPDQVYMGKKQAVCLSTEPVFTCPEDCVPAFLLDTTTRVSKSVGFNCFETKNREEDIAKYTKKGKSLYNKRVTLEKEVSIPDYCICSTTYNPKRRY